MSTKTLRKRIALVAVSALGFGLVSVAPASAAAAITAISVSTPAATTGTVGTTLTSPVISVTTTGAASSTGSEDAITLTLTITSRPAASTLAVAAAGAATTTASEANITKGANPSGFTLATATNAVTSTPANSQAAGTHALGTVSIRPNTPGTYVLALTPTGGAAGATLTANTITFVVLPSTSTTTTLTATNSKPVYTAEAVDAVITVSRNVGGVKTDGQILGRVDATANATSSGAIGSIFGTTAAKASGMTGALATEATAFTMDIDVIASVGAGVYATAGSYTFTFWNDTNSNGALDSGEPTTTSTVVIGAVSGATSLISASLSRTLGSNTSGFSSVTVTATVTDADGNPITGTVSASETTSLGSTTADADLTDLADATPLTRVGTTNTYVGTFAINTPVTAADYTDTYITVYTDNIAATATTSAKKALRVANDTALMTTTAGAKAIVLNQSTADTAVGTVSSGARQTLTGGISSNAAAIIATVDKTYVSHVYTINGASGQEGEYIRVSVAPAALTSNTVVAPTSYLVAIGADLTASITVTATAPAAADGYVLTVADGTNTVTSTITFGTAAPVWTVSPSANIKAKYADKSAVTGSLADNYGRVLASKAVSVVVTGRSAGTYPGTTDAAGAFKFEWTDASTSTVQLTDSLVFNYIYTASSTSTTTSTASSSARTVTYSATGIEVGSITVTAPSDTTDRAIDQIQGSSGAAATSRVNFTATVKTAAGAPVGTGLLVTFAGSSADLFYGGVTTAVTDEFGQATVSVFRKLAGTTAITATAGALTATAASVKWTNKLIETASPYTAALTADFHARYVTLTADNAKAVSEGIIRFTAKVTDRFGNAVDGVDVLFSETGAGRFYNAPATTTTNSAGEVSIDLNSQAGETGAVSVTVGISDANARQINDIAGFMTYTTATTTANAAAVTAVSGVTAAVKSATATAVIEKNTATSTADALLALAQALGTRDQASATVDAAAEATDAANAATDAANAAAEAADAATAAAQDASDAVAALSAQVSEAIAGLKKQLVSLTNLVIKIQKKVKA